MKELSIEEKAKAYDEAVEKAKMSYYTGDYDKDALEMLEIIFPELKESEDERIREAIIKHFKLGTAYTSFCGFSKSEIINYLEKQGEQKATIIIPKFRVGDEIKTSNEESLTITKIDEKGYWSEDLFICCFDEECVWDLVEQNPSWSEEDETGLTNTIIMLKEGASLHFNKKDIAKAVDFLKSLKERYTWKPSDEQMDALHYVTNFDYGGHKATLVSLYEQLKKLK